MPEPIIKPELLEVINEYLLRKNSLERKNLSSKALKLSKEKVSKPTIYVGISTCSIIAGALKTLHSIKSYISENRIEAEVHETGCNGLCSMEPFVYVQMPGKYRVVFNNVTEDKVEPLLNEILVNTIPTEYVFAQYPITELEPWPEAPFMFEIPFFQEQNKIITRNCGLLNVDSLEQYIGYGGFSAFVKTLKNYTPENVCTIIEESDLLGRGGGSFSTGKKFKIAKNTAGEQKYLICNADESDPGAYTNRSVIESDPYRLIEGIAIAAYAIGATKAFIFIKKDYELPSKRLQNAINKVKENGFLGFNILDSGFNLDITIKQGARSYVCGEETAMINCIEGKRAMPTSKPPYPATKGLYGKPTVVNNSETLMNIPDIIFNGFEWYQSLGTKNNKGTKVFCINGKVKNKGIIEVNLGTNLEKIINNICDGIENDNKLKAVVLGGMTGGVIPESLINIPLDYQSLKAIDANLGAGGILILDDNACMVDIAKYYMEFYQRESCGKCIPCREGTRRMYEILEYTTKRPNNESQFQTLERFKGVMQLETIAEVIKETSMCGLGKSAPNCVLNTLKYFRDEYESHIFDRNCKSKVCKELRTFLIDIESCTGCTACAKKCPSSAIIGSPKHPHFIVEEKCIGCGICEETCKFNAIIVR